MRFSALSHLQLTATVVRTIAGELHPDGRRYLPRLVLQFDDVGPDGNRALQLVIVDRHHVSIADVWDGRHVELALICALSRIERQTPPLRNGWLLPQTPLLPAGDAVIAGEIVALPVWEDRHGAAEFNTIYTEFVLRVGHQTIGVKTGMAADGSPALAVGDQVLLTRSRIDLLRITAAAAVDQPH